LPDLVEPKRKLLLLGLLELVGLEEPDLLDFPEPSLPTLLPLLAASPELLISPLPDLPVLPLELELLLLLLPSSQMLGAELALGTGLDFSLGP